MTGATAEKVYVVISGLLYLIFGLHYAYTQAYCSHYAEWQPVMKFDSPIMQSATLPGPLYYLKLRKPGTELPMEVQLSLPRQGHTLITDHKGNYFRLQLNVLHCVEAVTCLSNNRFHAELFIQLYGKHESFFNKLLFRYQTCEIRDFYEYFTQPWMSALYQESFGELLRDINDQDVGKVFDLLKSKSMRSTDGSNSSTSQIESPCCDLPSCGFGPKEDLAYNAEDIPSECGQSLAVRKEAAELWKAFRGKHIVVSNLIKYLARHSVTNPHYALSSRE